MKNISILSIFFSFVLLCGCAKESIPALVGDWELDDIIYAKAAQIGDCPVEVTISFHKDGTFNLTQVIGEGLPRPYSGTWSISGDILSGTYDDGSPWGATYTYSVSGDILTLTPLSSQSVEAYLYTRLH